MAKEVLLQEIAQARERLRELEAELSRQAGPMGSRPKQYTTYDVLAGCTLGMFGAIASLLFNIVGATLVGKPPLYLISVYLTFPLGAQVLDPSVLSPDKGIARLVLAVGCCLYLFTGMALGVPIHLVLKRWFGTSSAIVRFMAVTVLSLVIWIVNFYLLLAWLQPALVGGNWIVNEVPWWVAAATHLVFGWTVWLAQPLGIFQPAPDAAEAA
ncbi:MAG TPA: hypothetical protein PKD86_12700 [Gemmatales bacterium]|nr:hypothetical protein [Gemmatales bacterium]HMP60202.1 hypothetical protein [Gemmatales bacterium]